MGPFACSRCGAPLALPHDLAVVDVECNFCKTRTPVPAEHRRALSRARGAPEPALPARAGAQAVLWLALGLGICCIALVFFSMGMRRRRPTPSQPAVPAATAVAVKNTAAPLPEHDAGSSEGLGRLVATFGGKGTAAGLYEDARTITVDPDGNVYVGEYSSGRIHQFDAAGKFVRVINVPPRDGRSYLFGLAADWSGNLYVSRAHEVLKLSRKDGAVLSTIRERGRPDRKHAVAGEVCARAIALDASGELFVASNCTPEGLSMDIDPPNSLVKFDAKGKQVGHYASEGGFDTCIAAEGTGTVYLAPNDGPVHVYGVNGKFENKWGQTGNDPGDFRGPISGLAVDGRGHVLVLTWQALQAFDAGGKYQGDIASRGGRALAVGPKGEAYVLDDKAIRKYELALR